MDWLKRFFSEPGTFVAIFTSGVVGFCVGVASGVVQKRRGGWPAFFSAVATGTIIAVIVGLSIQDYVKSEALRFAIVGVCAVVSDDIWEGLRTLGKGLRTDPLGTLVRVLDAFRGKAPTTSGEPLKE